MPGRLGHRGHRQGQGALAADRSGGAHRQVIGRYGCGGPAPRGLRLSDQALQVDRTTGAARPRGRKARADSQVPGASSAKLERLSGKSELVGHDARHASRAKTDRQGCSHQFHGLDSGRDRHRQGTGRAGIARPKLAGRHAICRDQLRGLARESDRKRTVRSSQRQLHRRGPDSHRPVRSGQRRHVVSGRDRRGAQADASQTAALARKRRDPPGRRERVLHGRRADRLRHASQPANRWLPTAIFAKT